jgi:hypothetical protein
MASLKKECFFDFLKTCDTDYWIIFHPAIYFPHLTEVLSTSGLSGPSLGLGKTCQGAESKCALIIRNSLLCREADIDVRISKISAQCSWKMCEGGLGW